MMNVPTELLNHTGWAELCTGTFYRTLPGWAVKRSHGYAQKRRSATGVFLWALTPKGRRAFADRS